MGDGMSSHVRRFQFEELSLGALGAAIAILYAAVLGDPAVGWVDVERGQLTDKMRTVDVPLNKVSTESGDRMVRVDNTGKQALTHFHIQERFRIASLSRVELVTGRTHQIRVHAAYIDHPLAGDEKYGDWEFNRAMKKSGLKRLFLHAETLSFEMPNTGRQGTGKQSTGKQIKLTAPLPSELDQFLNKLV